MSSNKSRINSILADLKRGVQEAKHPLAKIVRKLILERGINSVTWEKLVQDHIKNDPAIIAKNLSNADKSQERNRINSHVFDPNLMTFKTVDKFARVVRASKMVTRIELIWEDPDTGEILDRVIASATEIITVK